MWLVGLLWQQERDAQEIRKWEIHEQNLSGFVFSGFHVWCQVCSLPCSSTSLWDTYILSLSLQSMLYWTCGILAHDSCSTYKSHACNVQVNRVIFYGIPEYRILLYKSQYHTCKELVHSAAAGINQFQSHFAFPNPVWHMLIQIKRN